MMPEAGGAKRTGDGSLFSDVGMMVVEGRLARVSTLRGFKEGPHCPLLSNSPSHHACVENAFLCDRAEKLRQHMRLLSENGAPLCVEVMLCPNCSCGVARAASTNICQVPTPEDLLLEQWTISLVKDMPKTGVVDDRVLLQAVRSQLHFSQLASWCSLGKVHNITYRVCHPPVGVAGFSRPPITHEFPPAKISASSCLKVSLKSLPRLEAMPYLNCSLHHMPLHRDIPSSSALNATVTVFKSVFAELGQCLLDPPARIPAVRNGFTMWRESKSTAKPTTNSINHTTALVDDRMLSGCQHIGKHRCEDDDSGPGHHNRSCPRAERSTSSIFSALSGNRCNQFLNKTPSDDSDDEPLEAELLLTSLLRRGIRTGSPGRRIRPPTLASGGGASKIRSPPAGVANPLKRKWATERGSGSKKLLSDSDPSGLVGLFNRLDITPSSLAIDLSINSTYKKNDIQEKIPSHPPTPTPHPRFIIPRQNCWNVGLDSSSEETEGESPISLTPKNGPPWSLSSPQRPCRPSPTKPRCRPPSKCSKPLLGNFEENILNGRLRPTSVVEGFTADLGASGSFCPQHLKLSVTMSFFSIEPHSAPSLGEMQLGKKGYTVPLAGTIQLTLLNPLGTVVKMFVVNYDVSDMPPNCHTFVRQRSISPSSSNNFLIHLRLRSSKSGRISLWGDVKTLLCRRQYDCIASAVASDEPDQTVILVPTSPRYTLNKRIT